MKSNDHSPPRKPAVVILEKGDLFPCELYTNPPPIHIPHFWFRPAFGCPRQRRLSRHLLKQLYDCVIKANASYGQVEDQIEDLIDLTRRMIQQRESVKEAYGQGWRGALNDLVDRLNRAEYADLQQALDALDEIRQGKR